MAVAQHAPLAAIRAQPAADFFALAEAIAEQDGERREWEAMLAGATLK